MDEKAPTPFLPQATVVLLHPSDALPTLVSSTSTTKPDGDVVAAEKPDIDAVTPAAGGGHGDGGRGRGDAGR